MNLVLSDWLTTGCRYGGSIGESGFIRLVVNRMYVGSIGESGFIRLVVNRMLVWRVYR